MPRIRFRNFARGLWLMGAREEAPDGTMRRNRGLSVVRSLSARSRDGSLRLYGIPAAHSLFKFGGTRFQGAADVLYRDGVSILSGLSGRRLAFVAMPPQSDKIDNLFVTDGVTPIKVGALGAISNWGLLPPQDIGPAGTIADNSTALTKSIFTFNGTASGFLLAPGSDPPVGGVDFVANESHITIAGGSMELSIGPGTATGKSQAYYINFTPLDLTTFGSQTSPDEDFIVIWIHVEHPARIEQVSLTFSSNDTTFGGLTDSPGPNASTYVRHIHVEDSVKKKQLIRAKGLGDLAPVTNQDAAWFARIKSEPETMDALEQTATTELVATRHTWTRLRLPKSTFHGTGRGSGPSWANIQGIMVGVRTNMNGRAHVYFDECFLLGGYGMLGDYQYLFTRLNANTGSRSNPNATPLVVKGNERNSVVFFNIPQKDVLGAADAQVTHTELWRTLGNGSVFFIDDTIPIGTTAYLDTAADYVGFSNATGARVLGDTILPTDNAPPRSALTTIDPSTGIGTGGFLGTGAQDAVGPHQGRMWWTRDDGAGASNLYFSPAGRPESVAGFLTSESSEDQGQKVVRWNDTLFWFTTDFVYEVVGTTEPFFLRKVMGVPGTVAAFTVVACPDGIRYQAADGIRLFDGVSSNVITYDAIGLLYDGQTAENLMGFSGVIAAYARDEYVISNALAGGNGTTLAYHVPTGSWREVGVSATALYFEDDLQPGHLIVGAPAAVLDFELPGQVTDDGAAIPLSWQTPSRATLAGQQAVVQRVYVECVTGGALLTPTILLDGSELVFPPFVVPGPAFQVIDLAVARSGRILGVRLDGSVAAAVEVTGIEVDLYVPGGSE